MRVLMVTESPPSTDPAWGDGSTMISAHLLRKLPADIEVDLVYFRGEHAAADPAALARARSVRVVPQRSRRRALLAQPFTSLTRASWQRHVPAADLREWAREADVLYVHGLHVMHLALEQPLPVVAHEVDPWSEYWHQRAVARRGLRRWYDLVQARRAARLERAVAALGATLVVVNERDAASLRQSTGGRVEAVPNGVEQFAAAVPLPPEPVLGFVGTLDYPPNVEALTRLATDVWPRVREAVPEARLVVAGRHAGPEVLALANDGIEVVGEVADVSAVFRSARASIYAGVTGRGTKNSVTESLVAGCPVVASTESARGQLPGPHLLVGGDASTLADLAVVMLTDSRAAASARAACAAVRTQARGWPDAAAEMAALLRTARNDIHADD